MRSRSISIVCSIARATPPAIAAGVGVPQHGAVRIRDGEASLSTTRRSLARQLAEPGERPAFIDTIEDGQFDAVAGRPNRGIAKARLARPVANRREQDPHDELGHRVGVEPNGQLRARQRLLIEESCAQPDAKAEGDGQRPTDQSDGKLHVSPPRPRNP
jgi:hypothetical protein